ncbi:hypothetical protein PpBr36_07797 [Pyricularia pennisetigena]|uniref:hypothetical protein n=1 Tax=Pyricularia pennisetigena TaxID=1578925 RepID=UPI0011521DB9|nr:hypothetical protein PpBr36_07797 [Pyricularia pennisetigena]TLS25607.1 hypothetical protein PpBr36_07797 [Pyricularia pennisetigena]
MPRSSFSDNPLLRVSRPVSACSRCRTAKVKCDGKLPACTACEKAGRESECSAANDQFARGKERSYVAALELRVEKLERRLKFAKSRKASMALHDVDAPLAHVDDRKGSMANIHAAIYRKAARQRENSDVNALVSDFGFLSVNATAQDFEPSVSNMTFARLLLAASTADPLPEPQTDANPPRDVARGLVKYYLDNIYALYPFFPDVHLHSAVENLYQDDRRHLKHYDCWLFWMVLAIASTAQSRSCNDEYYRSGVEYVTRAMTFADMALMPGKETQIRSLLLLTQYSLFDPAHFDSWHLIGFTCRAIIDLGFHQDPSSTERIDKFKLNLRRKIFYCAYALDRCIGMMSARAFSFTDDAVNVALPSMTGVGRIPSISGTIKGPESSDPAILLFQLRQTQSHWYQTLVQSDPSVPLENAAGYVWQMCHEMREWFESLPDGDEGLPTAIRQLFELELKYSYVYCIAPSSRAPTITSHGRLLIYEYAVAYMNDVYDMVYPPDTKPQIVLGEVKPSPSLSAWALLTYDQALRVYFMGSQFLAVMDEMGETLLSESPVPVPLPLPGTAPPPPMPERRGGDNLDRSFACVEKTIATLKKFGDRWNIANMLAQEFDRKSKDLCQRIEKLKALRSEQQEQQRQQVQQQQDQKPHHQQHQPHHQHNRSQTHVSTPHLQHQAPPPPQYAMPMGPHSVSPMSPPLQQHMSPSAGHMSPSPGRISPPARGGGIQMMAAPPPHPNMMPGGYAAQPHMQQAHFQHQPPFPGQLSPLPPQVQQHPHMQQHPSVQHHTQPAEVSWAPVDINEIMRQGGGI